MGNLLQKSLSTTSQQVEQQCHLQKCIIKCKDQSFSEEKQLELEADEDIDYDLFYDKIAKHFNYNRLEYDPIFYDENDNKLQQPLFNYIVRHNTYFIELIAKNNNELTVFCINSDKKYQCVGPAAISAEIIRAKGWTNNANKSIWEHIDYDIWDDGWILCPYYDKNGELERDQIKDYVNKYSILYIKIVHFSDISNNGYCFKYAPLSQIIVIDKKTMELFKLNNSKYIDQPGRIPVAEHCKMYELKKGMYKTLKGIHKHFDNVRDITFFRVKKKYDKEVRHTWPDYSTYQLPMWWKKWNDTVDKVSEFETNQVYFMALLIVKPKRGDL